MGGWPWTKGDPGMPGAQVTMAEMMREAGYVTGHIGKWHLGYDAETMPNGQGFDLGWFHKQTIDERSAPGYDVRVHRPGRFLPERLTKEF